MFAREHKFSEYAYFSSCSDAWLDKAGRQVETKTGMVRLGSQFRQKVETIGRHSSSQRGRSGFSHETFLAMARLRRIGCNAPEGLAEAFYVRKILF
jgi:hypothetical protein